MIIADDEPLALRRLEIALAAMPDVELVGTARDGLEALHLIALQSPHILFLDINMPKLSGIELVERLDCPTPPAVVFVTAFDRFAVDAFREGAVDYLLKPLDEDRLREALDRARTALTARDADRRLAELRVALAALQRGAELRGQFDEHLWISERRQTMRLPLRDVEWFEASGDYVLVHAGGRDHLIYDSLRELEVRLDPRLFLRVHRAAIVRLAAVTTVSRSEFGGLRLRVASGAEIAVSRSHKKAALKMLCGGRAQGQSPIA